MLPLISHLTMKMLKRRPVKWRQFLIMYGVNIVLISYNVFLMDFWSQFIISYNKIYFPSQHIFICVYLTWPKVNYYILKAVGDRSTCFACYGLMLMQTTYFLKWLKCSTFNAKCLTVWNYLLFLKIHSSIVCYGL